MADPRDLELRRAALDRVRELQRQYDDLIPVSALQAGFMFGGRRISLGSFYSGIFRPKEMAGPAALCVVTAPPKQNRPAPYEDEFDEAAGRFTYRFRDPTATTVTAASAAERDNRALIAAHDLAVPLIYFRGLFPGQYHAVFPMIVTAVDRAHRLVEMQVGLSGTDTADDGVRSSEDARRYRTYEALYRLHQHRFRGAVLRAYRTRCAVCSLREAALLQASHIVDDRDPAGHATVVNGIALCAIHHLAYDRNLMGIDPGGVVHISKRLLDEVDGPMLANGIQHFHGAAILQPSRVDERPDPERLAIRFERFREVA
jgi:putative restriction endonuclease